MTFFWGGNDYPPLVETFAIRINLRGFDCLEVRYICRGVVKPEK
jgi:hypothetical protein